ncbi:MAG: hypothetical protein MI725_06525 [Pirellulales bacterium]|nr:hypothetical protein [Pirellulales bacterium]
MSPSRYMEEQTVDIMQDQEIGQNTNVVRFRSRTIENAFKGDVIHRDEVIELF